jgi:hypothetical protein
MKKDGRIESTGDRISMKYSLPPEAPKALPPFKRRK